MIPIRTFSGRTIDLEQPTAKDIDLADVARGLSNCCRFTGQVPAFYSVAQHSVLVAQLVAPEQRLAALLHDASEAYLGDVSRFLKHSTVMEGYRYVESLMREAIEEHFKLSLIDRPAIKRADDLAAMFERVVIQEQALWKLEKMRGLILTGYVNQTEVRLQPYMERLPVEWRPWTPAEAETAFLGLYLRIRGVA